MLSKDHLQSPAHAFSQQLESSSCQSKSSHPAAATKWFSLPNVNRRERELTRAMNRMTSIPKQKKTCSSLGNIHPMAFLFHGFSIKGMWQKPTYGFKVKKDIETNQSVMCLITGPPEEEVLSDSSW